MPKVDFYILDANGQRSLFFACQLIEKLHAEKRQIYINANTQDEAKRTDDLLWTYREDSFIPHNLYAENETEAPRIQIGYDQTPTSHHDTLINLQSDIPGFYPQFQHIIEIVFSDPLVQQLARKRYAQYRDQGCEITTYKIKANEL